MKTKDIGKIENVLMGGGIVCMPTDTVYGLLCKADSKHVVQRMLSLKSRLGSPGTTLFSSVEQLIGSGFIGKEIDACIEYWPGTVSIIISAPTRLDHISINNTCAIRIPQSKWLRELVAVTGPLTTSSANLTGEPTVKTVKEAEKIFGDKVDLYVDGGELDNPPSTILRLTGLGFEKIR